MQAVDTDFSSVFPSNTLYQIPYFQRPYVWSADQIKTFADSMRFVCDNYTQGFEYFMGTIISKQNQANTTLPYSVKDLIDGQQRVTTFVVFFKILSIVYQDDAIFDDVFKFSVGYGPSKQQVLKFKTSANDGKWLKAILSLSSDKKLNSLGQTIEPSTKLSKKELRNMPSLVFSYNYLREYVVNAKAEGFYFDPDKIKQGVKFVNMVLSKDDDEQVYFDNINSLGVRLTTGELMKNYMFTADADGFNTYNSLWAPIFENEFSLYWNGSITSGRRTNANIDQFFFYYIQIKAYENNNIPLATKKKLSQKEGVANHIKEYTTTFLSDNKQVLLDDITEYAKIYQELMIEDIGSCQTLGDKNTLQELQMRLCYLITKMKTSTMIPYVMYVMRNAISTEKIAIVRYLESYIIRRSLTEETTKNYNRFFRDILIGHNVLTLSNLKEEMQHSDDENSCAMPSDQFILSGLSTLDYSGDNETPKAILYMLELEKKNVFAQTQVFFPDFYTLEHLMPQNMAQWSGADMSRDHIYMLGNMGLITQALNSTIKNRPWKDKLEGFTYGNKSFNGFKSCCASLETMVKVLDKDEWNNTEIDERTINLANDIIKIWKE